MGYALLHRAESSPRPWGCFDPCLCEILYKWVFPTPVGVFPPDMVALEDVVGLPHARGGVSLKNQAVFALKKSSPRPWGCFHKQGYRPVV